MPTSGSLYYNQELHEKEIYTQQMKDTQNHFSF